MLLSKPAALEVNTVSMDRFRSPLGWLLLGMVLLFGFMQVRNGGLYPVVFADEWSYSKMSRLVPVSESQVPSYLYLWLFRVTNSCGAEFLPCVRVLNQLIWLLATPFIYLIARRFTSAVTAVGVALAGVTIASNSYSAYFMPESMYFAAFWVLCWLAVGIDTARSPRWAASIGAWAGLMGVIKAHALFLMPALLIFVFAAVWLEHRKNWVGTAIRGVCACFVAFCLLRWGLAWLFAQAKGMTLLGSLYGSQASSSLSWGRITELLRDSAFSAFGHLIALWLLYALPLVILAGVVLAGPSKWRLHRAFAELACFSIFVVGMLVAVTAFFTASVAGTGPMESLTRLHMRYYSFALPLLFVLVVADVRHDAREGLSFFLVWGLAFFSLAMTASAFLMAQKFQLSFVDASELQGHLAWFKVGLVLTVIQVLLAIAWLLRWRGSTKVFLLCLLPVLHVLQNAGVHQLLEPRRQSDVYDRAGQIARMVVGEERGDMLVIGGDTAATLRTLFHVDDARADMEIVDATLPIDLSGRLDKHLWILLVGNYEISPAPDNIVRYGGYSLVTRHRPLKADLSKGFWPGVFDSITGLGNPEPWGAWTIGPRMRLNFVRDLPTEFTLQMVARAFGPNLGKDFSVMAAGLKVARFSASAELSPIYLTIKVPPGTRSLEILVPEPVAPSSLGMGMDSRPLGLGIASIDLTGKGR